MLTLFDIRNALAEGISIYELPLKVTYYARVSTDKYEQLNSLENQVTYYENYIKENSKWTFVEGYVDEGISGTSTNKRDSFKRMIRDAKLGKFNLIITKEISRFARDTLDSISFTRKLLEYGVGVFFQYDHINTFNNELFCFQKRALSNLLFNSRVQIPTSDNTPIEITNGLKMGGKRYISNSIGCNNKWSITESSNGIYFIDNITNSIYLFNGQINSLSDKLGFRQWIGENNSELPWTPKNFNNFITFYDKNNDDIYFVNKNTSLVYSELLGQFTSFIDYGNTQAMFNIGSDFYAIYNDTLWEQFAGEYNYIYNEYKPYSITFISNAEESVDKIFNTIEYRADRWDNNLLVNKSPFNKLEVWNEHQKGVTSLDVNIAKPSSLKRKFRVWRATVPRFNTDWNGIKANNRDRIRNTWAYIRLSNTEDNTNRAEIHDAIVQYFI